MSFEMVTLGELCRRGGGGIQTGPFGSQLHAADYVEDGIPSVMPQNIRENSLSAEGIARVSDVDAERLTKHRLIAGDIVYSRRGDVEKRAWVRPEQEGWLCGTGCLRVRVGDRADSRFVSYALGTEDARTWIRRHAVGATMLNLNTSILGQVPLPVPAFREQVGIAEVLGALDDKIAANRSIAGTADALIRERYAHLGDADGRVTVGTLATNRREPVLPVSTSDEAYVGMEHLPRRHMWLHEWGDAGQIASVKTRFYDGDILFGKLRPYFHKVVSAPLDGMCSTEILVCAPKRSDLAGFALAALSSDAVVGHSVTASNGTRMPRASWEALAHAELPWPGDGAAIAFSRFVQSVRAAVIASNGEIRTLAALRDTLLPELMSGRLTVKDAERSVEEAL